MVLVSDWDVFYAQSQAMLAAAPLKTRLTLKYRHGDGKLSAKVTDGARTITQHTEQASDVRFVDRVALHLASYDAPAVAPQGERTPQSSHARESGAQRRKRQRDVQNVTDGVDTSSAAPRGRASAAARFSGVRAARHAERRSAKRARREERRLVEAAAATSGTRATKLNTDSRRGARAGKRG